MNAHIRLIARERNRLIMKKFLLLILIAIILPMAFVSNIFIQVDDAPDWIVAIGNFFPLKHFAESFQDCFTPFVEPPAFDWASMGYVALWGVLGLVVALRRFTWEPSGSAPRGRRSRRATADATP